MKKILGTYSNAGSHWVGDGFPVRTLFSHHTMGRHLSPFLMLDYAGPKHFSPRPVVWASGNIRTAASKR